MNIFQRALAFLRRINTHTIGALGVSLVSLGGSLQLPAVQSGISLIHDGGKTQGHATSISVALIGLGTILSYFGRPATVPPGPVAPPPVAH